MLFGNAGLRLSDDSTNFLDYADYPMPTGTRRIAEQIRLGEILDHEFMKFGAEFSSEHDLVGGFTYGVRTMSSSG